MMKLNIQRFAITKSTTFTESNISVENNTSSLKIRIKFSANNDNTYFSSETLNCTCNGVTKSKQVAHPRYGGVDASFTFNNIQHNNDGTKTVNWSWSCATGTNVLGTQSANGQKKLTTIPRASVATMASSPAEMGSVLSIAITSYIANVHHILKYEFINASGTIGTVSTGIDSYVWTPDVGLALQIPNLTSGNCNLICETYDSNDVLLGTNTTTFTLEVPSSVVPTVTIGTITEADTTMQSLNWGVYVQNKSKLNIPVTATGIYNSTITNWYTRLEQPNGNNRIYETQNTTTDYLNFDGTYGITAIPRDSRGRSATATTSISVVAYSNPQIITADVQRCLSDGTLSDNGTYVLINYKASIASVSNNNSKLHRIGYKKTTDDNYTYVTLSSNYDVDIQNQISSFTISADYSYDIIFEALDSFMTSSIGRVLDTGFDLMNFNASGKAMAIGKVSTASANQRLLEVNLPTEFLENIETQDITCGDITAGDITSTSIDSTSGSFDSVTITDGTCNVSTLTINNEAIITTDEFTDYTGATAADTTANMTFDVSKTGYTPIGIVGVYSDGSRASFLRFFRFYLDGTDAKVSYRNVSVSSPLVANDTSVTVQIAYIRS